MPDSSQTLLEAGRSARTAPPCALIIFGATGDLTGRKLAPALYNLGQDGLLPPHFLCVGFARRDKTSESFRDDLKKQIAQFSRTQPLDEKFWQHFQSQIFYHRSEFDQDEGYASLAKFLADLETKHATRGNRIFYLSVQPKFFPIIIQKLKQFGLVYDEGQEKERFSRVIIEKPFGKDFASAQTLQQEITQHLDESQIYRIDHYLGKETVQNLLVFRFANSIFESLWNARHIEEIQITVAEEIGIGTRGHFFEEEGLLRDIVQNHMMQLLTLVAMEPPANLSARSIHDEKVKVLQSIRPFSEEDLSQFALRGQYSAGYVNGEKVLGYLEENHVNPQSCVETYVAIRLFIDNWRWSGVPFYLRAGKRLPKRATEIAIRFHKAPGVLFQQNNSKRDPNVLVIRIQPDEGIALKIQCKVPGPTGPIQPVKMDFRYGSYFGKAPPEAYERLIWECMLGDSTLFARSDEVMQSWHLLTPILQYWQKQSQPIPLYSAGTWGPDASDAMMRQEGRTWRIL